MGNSVSLRVWSEHDDDVIVNSPFISRRRSTRIIPTIVTTENGSSSTSSSTIALSAGSSSSEDEEAEINEKSTLSPSVAQSPIAPMRQCWICYGEEEVELLAKGEEPFNSKWVSPCACKGTTKWVHQSCILDWVDSQMRLHPAMTINLACPQCHTPYRLHQSSFALPLVLLRMIDGLAGLKERFLIYSTLGLASSAIYTLALSHGLWSGWMVGGSDFLHWMHSAYDPVLGGSILARLQVSAGIPLIPFYALSLEFPGMAGWLYPISPLLLYQPGMHVVSLRSLMMVLPFTLLAGRSIVRRLCIQDDTVEDTVEDTVGDTVEDTVTTRDSVEDTATSLTTPSPSQDHNHSISAPTLKISILSTTAALLFPTASALLGRLLCFHSEMPVFQKSLLGAGIVLAVRGVVRWVYWYQQERLKRFRRVLNNFE
jgi:hypothetical protein